MVSLELKFEVVEVPMPEGVNVIIGKTHFIKTVEDLYEVMATSHQNIRFGICMNEASGKRLVRHDGNDEELRKLAVEACLRIGVGHLFVIYMRGGWPINVLNDLKMVQEVVSLEAATANPVRVVVADLGEQRALVGIADGFKPLGVEGEEHIKERREFLRKIGYKR
ncbi:MAG: adenosine-specific kinase [Acidilobaceae archaeon]|nr:adenosine-specific kinase [Acidilobaceae archaeon]